MNWQKTCQKCKKEDKTTQYRTITTKNYKGPCADSFCYGSCDSEICRPISVTVCDDCAKEIGRAYPNYR